MSEAPTRVKTVIIGAGIAGLKCAAHLAQHDELDFIILEARNRIGGRILSIPFGGQTIELGASWIHGILGNPLFEYCCQNQLLDINYYKRPANVVVVTENGQRVQLDIVENVYNIYFSLFKKCEDVFGSCSNANVSSVGEQLEKDINAWLSNQKNNGISNEMLVCQKMIFKNLMCREAAISGCHSMSDVSLQSIGSYEEFPGGNVPLPSGFQLILQCLQGSIHPDKVLLKHPVKTIHWKQGCQSDLLKAEERHWIRINCENGKSFDAQHVVITIPLGCLKKTAPSMFVPSLPEEKMDSINKIGFGTVDKIFLEYDKPFLNPEINEILLLWNDADMDNIPKNWYKKLHSFTKVSDTILMTWISGLQAEYMEEISDDEIANKCTEILSNFLLDPYLPKPIRIIRTTWHNQLYTQGSYSYIPVGSSQSDLKLLAEPLFCCVNQNKPTLQFAGEATHQKYYSTAHGAFLMGQEAADRLLMK